MLGDLLECLTYHKHRSVWLLDEYIQDIMFSCLGYTKTIPGLELSLLRPPQHESQLH